jgi:hypothetical protein
MSSPPIDIRAASSMAYIALAGMSGAGAGAGMAKL